MIEGPCRTVIRLAFTFAALSLWMLSPSGVDSAFSQARAIKIVNPFPPGGTADIVARVLAEQIGRAEHVTVLVENRPGAGTAVGTEVVERAEPDGNTLLITTPDFVVNPQLRKLNYNPLTSFQPICSLVQSPQVLVVNGKSTYRTLADLFSAARAGPSELTFASVGPASPLSIAVEMLKRTANFDMTYVPFPGNAPTINALLGQHVTAAFSNYADVADHLRSGTLRALATPSRRRIEALPDVPTISESGYKNYELDVWFGMFAPVKVPNDKILQIASWLSAAMVAPEVKARFAPLSLQPDSLCGGEFGNYVRKQFEMYGQIIHEANIKVE